MDKDRIKGSAQQAKGKVKEVAGKATGDKKTTRDIGGRAGTSEFAGAVIAALETSKEPAAASR